jgi:hypothetical protein
VSLNATTDGAVALSTFVKPFCNSWAGQTTEVHTRVNKLLGWIIWYVSVIQIILYSEQVLLGARSSPVMSVRS